MKFFIFLIVNVCLFFGSPTFANPYWDPQKAPLDRAYPSSRLPLTNIYNLRTVTNDEAINALRIQVNWNGSNESYKLYKMVVEPSATPALLARSTIKPKMGSYIGILKDVKTQQPLYYDAIGTGKEYRKLARAINLRFPVPKEDMIFELYAENPSTGVMEKVVSQPIAVADFQTHRTNFAPVEVKEIARASKVPSLRINIYADGYLATEKEIFWQHAVKAVNALQKENFPGVESMSFYAVFSPSNKKLGKAEDLGRPVPEYDSFLGLYYPYWDNFGRWYNIVYPTREDKFRQGLASAPYDYPIVLINNSEYWGVGNYMSLTAIPAASGYFTYLLLHEFGHFFGLNEEYEGGGRTELEFAPSIPEPWSQNITFLANTKYDKLKWNKFVNPKTPLPTPRSEWKANPPVYGAYQGGYADSAGISGKSHKPGRNCVMESKSHFCDICVQAINQVVQDSIGA